MKLDDTGGGLFPESLFDPENAVHEVRGQFLMRPVADQRNHSGSALQKRYHRSLVEPHAFVVGNRDPTVLSAGLQPDMIGRLAREVCSEADYREAGFDKD
jgi:hypothetical protein